MNISTTVEVGAQHNHAPTQPDFGLGLGQISQQSGFQPVLRRKLMAALSMVGRDLGLRPATLMVLDSLLSFLPCRDAKGQEMPVTPLHLLTIYAANDTISFRARGLTDRQLRRHFEILERKGLIQRRDSANGKRFPIYQNGKVVGAYGIDLMPLFRQASEILSRAETLRAEHQELRGLKAQIMQLRGKLLDIAPALPTVAMTVLDQLRNLTRRVGLKVIEAKTLLARLQAWQVQPAIQPSIQPEMTTEKVAALPVAPKETTVCDGQNVRHNKPKDTYTKKSLADRPPETKADEQTLWQRLTGLNTFFPEQPRNLSEYAAILTQTAEMLRIDRALFERLRSSLQPQHLAQVLDRILRNPEAIEQPNGYLAKILRCELAR